MSETNSQITKNSGKKSSSITKLSNTISSLIKKNQGFSKYSDNNSGHSRKISSSFRKKTSPLSIKNSFSKGRKRQASIKSSSSSYLKNNNTRLSIGSRNKAKLRNTSSSSNKSNKSKISNVSSSSNNLFAKNLMGKATRKASNYSTIKRSTGGRIGQKSALQKFPKKISKKASDFMGGRPSFKKDVSVLQGRIESFKSSQALNNKKQRLTDAANKMDDKINGQINSKSDQKKNEVYKTPITSKLKTSAPLDKNKVKGVRATLEELRMLKTKLSSSSKNRNSNITNHKCDCYEEVRRLREENSDLRDVVYTLLEQFNQNDGKVNFNFFKNFRFLLTKRASLRR